MMLGFQLMMVGVANAAIWFVDADLGRGDGLSWATAFGDLNDALAVANPGDQVWVAEGLYAPDPTDRSVSFEIPSGVGVYGGFEGTETMLEQRDLNSHATTLSGEIGSVVSIADNSYHVVTFVNASSSTILDGFFVFSGYADGTGNDAHGGGLLLVASSPQLVNLTVARNSAAQTGGGLFAVSSSHAEVRDCVFQSNQSDASGGAAGHDASHLTYTQVVIRGNLASDRGGGIANTNGSSSLFTNVSFALNSASNGASLLNLSGTSAEIANSILWNPGSQVPEIRNSGSSLTTISHSLVRGSFGSGPSWVTSLGIDGGSNLDADPRFVNGGATGVRLLPDSPAIDAGDDSANPLAFDLDGGLRIVGSGIDLGPYEGQCDVGPVVFVDADAQGAGDGSSWTNAFVDLVDALAEASFCSGAAEIWVAEGTYKPSLIDREIAFSMKPGVSVFGGFIGGETQRDQRDPSANATILSGDIGVVGDRSDNSHTVVDLGLSNVQTVIDGFTIRDGQADGGLPILVRGAGILCIEGGATLRNLLVTENRAHVGGGFHGESAEFIVVDSVFSQNHGYGMWNEQCRVTLQGVDFVENVDFQLGSGLIAPGTGLYNRYSEVSVTNTRFLRNIGNAAGGGAQDFDGIADYVNVLFAENQGPVGGGYTNVGSVVTMTNATFSGNTAFATAINAMQVVEGANMTLVNSILWSDGFTVQDIYVGTATLHSSNSILEGAYANGGVWNPDYGTDGGSNLDLDPSFEDAGTGNYRPVAGSPAIDTGNPNAPLLPETDLDGNPRVSGERVDRGAYEYADPTGIAEGPVPSKALGLRRLAPNPFNPRLSIEFSLDREREVEVAIYNVAGRRVWTRDLGRQPAGVGSVEWNGRDRSGARVASGIYVVRVSSGDQVVQGKAVLVK